MKHNKNKNRASEKIEDDDPQSQVFNLLNNFPDISSDLNHLLHLIDSGKAVDITSISHKSLINPLKKLFLSLNLHQSSLDNGAAAFILPQDSPRTLDLVGSVFSTRSEKPVVGPDLPEKKKKKKKPVVGPVRPSSELLAAAAKLQEAEAALKEAEQEQELKEVTTSLIGPTQPERFEQVTRILLFLSDDLNVDVNYNPYDVLGLQQQRRMLSDEIKRKYLKLSLLVHPDKCSHPRANEAFVKVNEAFRELSDPVRRRAVDDRIEDKEREEERLRAMRGGGGESERARKAKREYLRARNELASLASDEERKKEKRKRGKERENEEEKWVGKHPWRPWDREKDWEGGGSSVKLDSEDLYEGVWSQF